MARVIAEYLDLDNPKLYTGHSFRRTSATECANNGASEEQMKRIVSYEI